MEVNNETIREIYDLGKSYFLTFKGGEAVRREDYIYISWGLYVLGIYDNSGYFACTKENKAFDTTEYVKVASFGNCFVWRDKKYIK